MSYMRSKARTRRHQEGIAAGFETYWNNVKFIVKHPFMLIPFIIALLASSYLVYYISGMVDIDALTTIEMLGLAFLFTVITTFFISITALFVLELLEQHETNGQMKPGKALKDMLTKDLWRALPFIIVWAIIDFIIMLLLAMVEASKDDDDSYRKRRRDRRRTQGLKLFQTTIRMGTMTIFTIIAWENRSIKESYQKGMQVFKDKILVLIGGSALSRVTSLIMLGPVIGLYLIAYYTEIDMTVIYYIIMIYLVISWSFGRLVEQLYVSEYYLWYYKFEEAQEDAKRYHKEVPKGMHDIEKPSFSDNVLALEKMIPYEDEN